MDWREVSFSNVTKEILNYAGAVALQAEITFVRETITIVV